MAVKLRNLYNGIDKEFEVTLHTEGCFDKVVSWIHMVEDRDFIPLLHGDELVFNSGLNYDSDEWLKDFIWELNKVNANGLIIALRDGHEFSKDMVEFCNELHFPLFSASWRTPYIDIMRNFAETLIQYQHKETSLNAALKSAIFTPENEELYMKEFEKNGFSKDTEYDIAILSCNAYFKNKENETLALLEKYLHDSLKHGLVYEENGKLIIMAAGKDRRWLRSELERICKTDEKVYVGVGASVNKLTDIHKAYNHAYTAYQLTKTAISKNILFYEQVGIYKVLSKVNDVDTLNEFVDETLGKLLEYDRKQGTNYIKILEVYFENECSILASAQKLYCHKNTLSYKLNDIRDILGYEILDNEHRMSIMLAFSIMKLQATVRSE